MPTLQDALTTLKSKFGFGDFREGQREVIESILAGQDTVVVMPTGGGKSLCFQLPALLNAGATVVVSPLIALMKDQVEALEAKQIAATFINSTLSFEEQKQRIGQVRRGQFKLVYVAPERFRSQAFVEALKAVRVALFAVDEAHCVSHWGHDFRPDYLRLKQAAAALEKPQIVALTATATPYVRSDIIEQLGMRDARTFVSGFDRPNLRIDVVNTARETDKIQHIKRLSSENADASGIVYTSTRKAVEQVTQRLSGAGLSVIGYHAGMSDIERNRAHENFMSGRTQMIVATNAFGMGIDKPDIRFVAHFHMPGSLEAYYQEIGRAGRDGLPSKCSLLFNYADKRTQDFFIEGSYPTPETIKKVYEVLAGLGRKRIELSAAEIASRAGIRNEMAVSSALYTLEKAGHIDRSSSAENRASVRLNVSPAVARATMGERDSRPRQVLFALMNGWNLNQRTEMAIDVSDIGDELGLEASAVKRAIASLVSESLITYAPASRTRGIVMLDDPPARQLRVRPQEIAKRAALEQRKLREMINFCYTDRCYRAFILDYFGDSHHQSRCGTCGNCAPHGGRKAPKPDQFRQSETPSDLDRFIREGRPFGHELGAELDTTTSRKKDLAESERLARADLDGLSVNHARALSNEEKLLVRKILACAARMQGRFGKIMLASTLRGSRARNLLEAGLNELSTYGILSDMTQEELMTYIDGLVVAGALKVSPGAYPTISITALGGEVMRERAEVELSISETPLSRLAHEGSVRLSLNRKSPSKKKTVDETYRLHCEGMSVDDIATQRGLTVNTVEAHLAECIVEGREFDMSRHVGQDAYRLISAAIAEHGTSKLRPLKDALPEEITWGMIKFVIADHERSSAK